MPPMRRERVKGAAEFCLALTLLLSVVPPATCARVDDPASYVKSPSVFPHLTYAASLLNDVRSAHYYLLAEEEEEEDMDISEEPTDSTSTQGDLTLALSNLNSDVIKNILSFSNARDLTAARATSKHMLEISSSFVKFRSGMVFFAFPGVKTVNHVPPKLTRITAGRDAERSLRETLQWQCSSCRYWNATGRVECGNSSCREPCPPQCNKVQRVFAGQLRKEDTAISFQWMVQMLAPEVELLHVESHTTKEGRGKGCAWVYTSNDDHHVALLKLHKRVYMDVLGGQEGIFVCLSDDASTAALEHYALVRSADASRPRNVLPRKSVVVEVPKEELMSDVPVPTRTPPLSRPHRQRYAQQAMPYYSTTQQCTCEVCSGYPQVQYEHYWTNNYSPAHTQGAVYTHQPYHQHNASTQQHHSYHPYGDVNIQQSYATHYDHQSISTNYAPSRPSYYMFPSSTA